MLYPLSYVQSAIWDADPKGVSAGVLYANATTNDKTAWTARLDLARERLLTSGKWRGMTVEAVATVYDGQFTAPRNVISVQAGISTTCPTSPLDVYGRGFRFSRNVGIAPDCLGDLADLGDGFVTFRDSPYDSFYVKAVSGSVEAGGLTLAVRGVDASGVYAAASLTLDNAGHTTTQVYAGTLTYALKSVTAGFISVYAVDTVTAAQTLIALYEPTETGISYHRYSAPWANDADEIAVLCTLGFVPLSAATDYVIPSNLGALTNAMRSLKYERENDMARAKSYWQQALQILEDERQTFEGDTIMPGMEFAPDYGCGSVLNPQ